MLPNFHNFNVIAAAAHGEAVPFALIWHNTLYAVAVRDSDSDRCVRGVFRTQFEMSTPPEIRAIHASGAAGAGGRAGAIRACALRCRRALMRDTLAMTQEKEELLLRSGPLLKKLSLGYDPLLADIYWTRAVQYYGSRARKPGATYE